MSTFKFRFTFSTTPDDVPLELVKELLGVLQPGGYAELHVGFETLDKYADSTHYHMHAHFQTLENVSLGAMRKRFQRWAEKNPDHTNGRTGNCLYSLTRPDDVQDFHRFYRYVYKQYSSFRDMNRDMSLYGLPCLNDSWESQRALAYEEWTRHVDQNRAARDKLLKKQEGREELFIYLEEFRTNIQNEKDILALILKFYVEKEKSANKNTILGYMYTAALKFGIYSYSDLAKKWLD